MTKFGVHIIIIAVLCSMLDIVGFNIFKHHRCSSSHNSLRGIYSAHSSPDFLLMLHKFTPIAF